MGDRIQIIVEGTGVFVVLVDSEQRKIYKWIDGLGYVLQSSDLLIPNTSHDPLKSKKGVFE